MTRLTVLLLAAYAVLCVATATVAQTIKLGTLAPEGSPWHEIMRDLGHTWKQATGGTVQLRIYAGGIVGDEPDMVRKMRIGQLHAAALTGVGLSDIVPEIQALQMPMMFRSYAELDYVRERLASRLEALLEAKGFKVLNWGDAGWVYFFTQQPVVSPEDLKPLKLFAWAGDTAHVEAWKDAGYIPVPLAATEIHTGLQSGLINAFPTTPLAALSFQWFGLAKHMTDLRWAPLVGALVVSTRMWQQLPEAVRPQLLKAAGDAGVRLRHESRTLNDQAIEVMRKHGLSVHPVPPDIAAHWERRARLAYPKLLREPGLARMVSDVEHLRDAYRAGQ